VAESKAPGTFISDQPQPSEAIRSGLLPIGVLISGQGTNLAAILRRCEEGVLEADVRVVIANRPEARGLEHARRAAIPTHVFSRSEYPDRVEQQRAIADCLFDRGVQLVVLAGFDQILVPEFVHRFPDRIINLHPSLLPAFSGGMHAVRDALNHGVKVTGCSVHFATDDLDGGPIIAQEAVAVEEDDTEAMLLARIHEVEYRLLPASIQLFAQGRLRIEGKRVRVLPG
jgi:phosphoribosylglycinamide formyltransferase-1